MSILLIDDDRLLLELFRDRLSDRRIVAAATFRQAEQLLRDGLQPELIVVDYLLDSGYTAIDVLELVPQVAPQARVVLMTGDLKNAERQLGERRKQFAALLEKGTDSFVNFINNLR